MARVIKDYQVQNPNWVLTRINSYLVNEGYEYIDFAGENVYKKGKGVWSGPSFFKIVSVGSTVHMETWMKYALLPGVYVGELGLTGVVGSAAKGAWKKRIDAIESIISTNYTAAPGGGTNEYQGGYTQASAQPRTASRYCSYCGAEIKENAAFCTSCGKPVNSASQNVNAGGQNAFPTGTDYGALPEGLSKRDFVKGYLPLKFVKDIRSIAILCYVCAGITAVVSILVNPYGVSDALLLLGLALGMHLGRSKVCAILILILSALEVALSIILGQVAGMLWLIAGISAVVTFNKIDKEYKSYLNR